MKKTQLRNTHLFWAVYIAFLFVLWPQAAWTIGQFQDASSVQWSLLGVRASPLAWALSGVFEATIAIVTHRLNEHWKELPPRYRAADMWRRRFAYQWLNVYAIALFIAIAVSATANYTHVVQFTNPDLRIFDGAEWSIRLYQMMFGLALPAISFVFARVLSTMRLTEQEDDPAFVKAKADLTEAKSTIREKDAAIRSKDEAIRQTERLLYESEQRYRAVGDVVRFLFGTDLTLRERIRGVRTTFQNLSQNGIAQLLGCSVSTVNDALQGYVIELPEIVEAQEPKP